MNVFVFKSLIILGTLCLLGLTQPVENNNRIPNDEDVPPQILSEKLTFLHKYNDTIKNGTQEASSKFTFPGGLANKIQNLGGVQKTILNNRIQYNFYFWLLPKNFNITGWGLEKSVN